MRAPICEVTFEEVLLSYVAMCYGVALSLTHDPLDAARITRATMEQAWHWQHDPLKRRRLKHELLRQVRADYLIDCRQR